MSNASYIPRLDVLQDITLDADTLPGDDYGVPFFNRSTEVEGVIKFDQPLLPSPLETDPLWPYAVGCTKLQYGDALVVEPLSCADTIEVVTTTDARHNAAGIPPLYGDDKIALNKGEEIDALMPAELYRLVTNASFMRAMQRQGKLFQKVCQKDELRIKADGKVKIPRVFMCDNIWMWLLGTILFSRCANKMQGRGRCLIGHSMWHGGTQQLYDQLLKEARELNLDDNFAEADISGQDTKQPAWLQEAVFGLFIVPDDWKELFSIYVEEIIRGMFVMQDGSVYRRLQGMPSGAFVTAIINTLVNETCMNRLLLEMGLKLDQVVSWPGRVYGDDSLLLWLLKWTRSMFDVWNDVVKPYTNQELTNETTRVGTTSGPLLGAQILSQRFVRKYNRILPESIRPKKALARLCYRKKKEDEKALFEQLYQQYWTLDAIRQLISRLYQTRYGYTATIAMELRARDLWLLPEVRTHCFGCMIDKLNEHMEKTGTDINTIEYGAHWNANFPNDSKNSLLENRWLGTVLTAVRNWAYNYTGPDPGAVFLRAMIPWTPYGRLPDICTYQNVPIIQSAVLLHDQTVIPNGYVPEYDPYEDERTAAASEREVYRQLAEGNGDSFSDSDDEIRYERSRCAPGGWLDLNVIMASTTVQIVKRPKKAVTQKKTQPHKTAKKVSHEIVVQQARSDAHPSTMKGRGKGQATVMQHARRAGTDIEGPSGQNVFFQSSLCFPAVNLPHIKEFSKGAGLTYKVQGRTFYYSPPATTNLRFFKTGITAIPVLLESDDFTESFTAPAGEEVRIIQSYSVNDALPNVASGQTQYTIFGNYSCSMEPGDTGFQTNGPLTVATVGGLEFSNGNLYQIVPTAGARSCTWQIHNKFNRYGLVGEVMSVRVRYYDANRTIISTTLIGTPAPMEGNAAATCSGTHSIPANTAFFSIENLFTLVAPIRLTDTEFYLVCALADIAFVSKMRAVVWPTQMINGLRDLAINGNCILAGSFSWLQNTTPTLSAGGTIVAAAGPPGLIDGPFPTVDNMTALLPDVKRWNAKDGLAALIVPCSNSGLGGLDAQYWTERSPFTINEHYTRVWASVTSSEPQIFNLKEEVTIFFRTRNPWLMNRSPVFDASDMWEYFKRNVRWIPLVIPNKDHKTVYGWLYKMISQGGDTLVKLGSDFKKLTSFGVGSSKDIRTMLTG